MRRRTNTQGDVRPVIWAQPACDMALLRQPGSPRRWMVSAAPLVGFAFLVWAVLQGEPGVLHSPPVLLGLSVVGMLGTGIAGWTALGVQRAVPTPVSRARAGPLKLRGTAQPLPGAPPLRSPSGAECLWYSHSSHVGHRLQAEDSTRAFLLVDGGACVVLPEGAWIDEAARRPDGAARTSDRKTIVAGGLLQVVGWLTPLSAEAIALQQAAAERWAAQHPRRIVVQTDDPGALERALRQPPALVDDPPPAAQALPVVGRGPGTTPCIVSVGAATGPATLFIAHALLDLLIALVAGWGWVAAGGPR